MSARRHIDLADRRVMALAGFVAAVCAVVCWSVALFGGVS